MPSHKTLTMADTAPMWPPEVTDYHKLLQNFSRDVEAFAHAHVMRGWMAPMIQTTHCFTLPRRRAGPARMVSLTIRTRGSTIASSSTTRPMRGLHAWCATVTCSIRIQGPQLKRSCGVTRCRRILQREDWPGIDADSEWDSKGVLSGNCAFDDAGRPVCIYSGSDCDFGVCAYSRDWLTWTKVGCMQHAPSVASQTNHDTAIFRVDGLWHLLIGGCTFNGSNTPLPGVTCAGNAQVWTSTDLRHIEYSHPLTPGGPAATGSCRTCCHST